MYTVGNKHLSFAQKDHIGTGGQAKVYAIGNTAYKIFHDHKLLIPEEKIAELQELKNITGIVLPGKPVYENNIRVGFELPYVQNSEFLVRLTSKQFKTDNGISPQMTMNLVEYMQKQLQAVHKTNICVCDYNQMNFLTDLKYKLVYALDVDSWKTKSFNGSAIMPSVQDMTVPMGEFSIESDWYSWAVVTFLLYTNLHPYRGKHPKYKKSDWVDRIKNKISVFNKDVSVPKFVDLSLIPKNHLEWYERIFEKGERSIPPMPTGIANNIQINKKIYSVDKDKINSNELLVCTYKILDVVYRNANLYVLSKRGLFVNGKSVISLSIQLEYASLLFIENDVVIAYYKDNALHVLNATTQCEILCIEINQRDYVVLNNSIYQLSINGIIEYKLVKLGNIACIPQKISDVYYKASRIYDGVVIQDSIGIYTAIIIDSGVSYSIDVPELSKSKIIDAKRINKWLFVIYSINGVLSCITILFSDNFRKYTCMVEKHIQFKNLNIVAKPNGVMIFNTEDNDIEIFASLSNRNILRNTPVYNDIKLYSGVNTMYTAHNKLYEMISK